MRISPTLLASCLLMLQGAQAFAAPDYSQLGGTLTRTGAEKAANADGSIPAYTGGLSATPAGITQSGFVRPDPFASEKPLLSINASNMAQYTDKLTAGTQALMKRYPDYRIDVYPTHRTASAPGWLGDNTISNAGKASIASDGFSLQGVRQSVPFPIPERGIEVMWNALTNYSGKLVDMRGYSAYSVNSAGTLTLTTGGRFRQQNDYYLSGDAYNGGLLRARADYSGPARRAGEAFLVFQRTNYTDGERRTYQYLPGQRRVKLAPDLSYDTPNTSTSGMSTMDDAAMFNGPMDRFDFTIVGKKEMYVPYNNYRMVYANEARDVFKPGVISPDFVRWELHRVWVVRATLKPGQRHVYKQRDFYIDEDSWSFMASDQYDARDNLWRAGFAYSVQNYDANSFFQQFGGHYDLIAGSYYVNFWPGKNGVGYADEGLPASFWAPDALAGSGIR
ncbi:DUF1329 domain-containing protein [Pseudomonas sp. NPDC090755]|uniref:DUF1329 domain-containing protein n=1 Tax=Pseudomonas sp. NPDC090755 TaxID=3364481 RepID=UPI00383A5209